MSEIQNQYFENNQDEHTENREAGTVTEERLDNLFTSVSKVSKGKIVRILALFAASFATADMAEAQNNWDRFQKHTATHEQAPSTESSQEIDHAKQSVISELPDDIVHKMMLLNSVTSPQERQVELEKSHEVAVSGFEKVRINDELVGNEAIEKFLQTLPKFLTQNVDSLAFDPTYQISGETREAYGFDKNDKTLLAATIERDVHIVQVKGGLKGLFSNIVYEFFRAADFEQNILLTLKERIELEAAILQRLNDPDHFKSLHLELIHNKNKRLGNYVQSADYYAEVGTAILSPTHEGFVPQKDKNIILSLLQKMDNKGIVETQPTITTVETIQASTPTQETVSSHVQKAPISGPLGRTSHNVPPPNIATTRQTPQVQYDYNNPQPRPPGVTYPNQNEHNSQQRDPLGRSPVYGIRDGRPNPGGLNAQYGIRNKNNSEYLRKPPRVVIINGIPYGALK